MIGLDSTTDSMEVVTGNNVSTDLTADYMDISSSSTTYTGAQTNVNNATTTLVPAPSSGHQITIKAITVHNNGATDQVVTVQRKVSSTAYTIIYAVLKTKQALHYFENVGWQIYDTTGNLRTRLTSGESPPSIRTRVGGILTASLAGTKSLTSQTSFAYYVGQAPPGGIASIKVRLRVTTAYGADGATPWAEIAVATGAPSIGGNANLTNQGSTDVSGTINATGQFTVTVAVTGTINEGDDVWIIFANKATTVAVLRADSLADDLTSGYQVAAATTRPSTMAASTVFTVEGATVLAPWFSVQ